MVQTSTSNQSPRRRGRANLPLVAGFALVLGILVLVAIFFRAGSPPVEEARTPPLKVQHQINSILFLATTAKAAGKRQEAIDQTEKALKLMETSKSNDWIQKATWLVTLSDLYRENGQWEKALAPLEKAKAVVVEHHLEEERITCEILEREGIFSYVNKKFVEAEDQFQQSLSCSQALNGSLSVETSQCLIWLAETYLSPSFNNPKRALQYLRMVEEVCSSSAPERPEQMMLCLKAQGIALMQLNKMTEAEEKLVAAQEIVARKLPANHNETQHIKVLLEQIHADKFAAAHR
ncbi:MAG: hypothetical protein DKT66_14635 [Candidatus Melainabacteria bacterium]|nr:MAG: hypothetical protein DKT66_14635 [Candidatus Melainabacteria bacterium]